MPPSIQVRQGDITTYDGDAVVNAANNHLILGAGVAEAIRLAGGPAIQEECDRHGPIRVGEAAITGAGRMTVRWIIHAAAMGDEPISEGSIRESTLASLRLAREHGIRRLALPVLGSGIAGFAFSAAATIMRDAVRESPDAAGLEDVVFYGYSLDDAATLKRLMG